MTIYIVGQGAVGTFLGDALRSESSEIVYAPRDLADVKPVDAELAIVAVKSYDTDSAIETLRRALGPETKATILCPQNGVGNEEKLAAAFGADQIVACALTVPLERTRDGRIVPERLVKLEDVFALEIRAIRECRAVMKAQGLASIDLPRYPVRALQSVAALPSPLARTVLATRIAGARGSKPPSLLLDLRAAKGETEVDVLNGAVAAAGRAHGVATPVNAVFARVLDDIAHMPQLWAKYRERPAALAAEVQAEEKRSRAVLGRA